MGYFFVQECMFYACVVMIGSWKGEKNLSRYFI